MPLSSKLLRYVTYPVWFLKHGRLKLLGYIKEFDKLQSLSTEELKILQLERIKGIIKHAQGNSPFYGQLFQKNRISVEDIKDLSDFEKLPIISKEDIRENLSSFLARNFSSKDLLKSNTGGSTGIPLTFYRDKRCLLYRRAIDVIFNRWLGVEIGDWTGWVWGASQDIRGRKTLKARLASHIFPTVPYYRAFFLHYEQITSKSIQTFIKQIRLKKPKLLVAYPNMIYQVARYMKEKRIDDVFVPSVVCGAEALFPHQRELIQSVFHSNVFERYGSREIGTVSSECECHKGMHIFSPSVYLEIIKDGKKVKPGEVGEIVVTDLLNYAMPFIRYRVGDMGSLSDRECECGRKLPLLEKVLGRTTSAVITPGGAVFAGQSLISIVRKGEVPAQIQIIQETPDTLRIKIVKYKEFNQTHLDYLEKELHQKLGQDMKINFEFVDNIPKDASGKYRYVISKVPIKFI